MSDPKNNIDLFSLKNGDLIFDELYKFSFIVNESRYFVRAKATNVKNNKSSCLRFVAPGVISNDEDLLNLKKAANTTKGYEHVAFLRPLGVLEEKGLVSLVEDWVDSSSLLDLIRKRGAFSEYESVHILAKLADALDSIPEHDAEQFHFSLSDIYLSVADREEVKLLLSEPFSKWPDWQLRLSPLSFESLYGKKSLEFNTNPLLHSFCLTVFHTLTGSMGDPLLEPVISEDFTNRLRNTIAGRGSAHSCKSILWDLFKSRDPSLLQIIRPKNEDDKTQSELFETVETIDSELIKLQQQKGAEVTKEIQKLQVRKKQLLDHHQHIEEQKEQLIQLEKQLSALSSDLSLQQKLREQQAELVGGIDQAQTNLQQSLENYREEALSLRKQVGGYKKFLKFAIPVVAVVILGFAIAFYTKPTVPDQPGEIVNWPKWKQQRLKASLAKKIQEQGRSSKWKESMGLLNIYIATYADKPPELEQIAAQATQAVLEEYEIDRKNFKRYYLDGEGGKVSLIEPLERISSWGVNEAGRFHRELKSIEMLEKGLANKSVSGVSNALDLLLQTRTYFSSDKLWSEYNSDLLAGGLGFIVSAVNDILKNWPNSKEAARKAVNDIRAVSDAEETSALLKVLSDHEFTDATYLLIAARTLEELQKENFSDPSAILALLKGFREQLPIERQRDLTEHLTNMVKTVRSMYQRNDQTFIKQLEKYDKPELVKQSAAALASALGLDSNIQLGSPDLPDNPSPEIISLDWFSRAQLRELYMFVADILTDHSVKNPILHSAYQYAANMGDPEGMHWAGRGMISFAMKENEILIPATFDKGVALLEESLKSENAEVSNVSLKILTESFADLGEFEKAFLYAKARKEMESNADAQLYYMDVLHKFTQQNLTEENLQLLLAESKAMLRVHKNFPEREQMDLLGKALENLKFFLFNTNAVAPDVHEELAAFFKLEDLPKQDLILGLKYYYRALWRNAKLAPFAAGVEQAPKAIFSDLYNAARLGFEAARESAKANGIDWHLEKEQAVKEALELLGS